MSDDIVDRARAAIKHAKRLGVPSPLLSDMADEITRLRAEVERLRKMALPFVAVHGERWSRERGLPDWHMAAHFYDMVKDLGGRVDGFIRVEMNADPVAEDIRALTPEASHD